MPVSADSLTCIIHLGLILLLLPLSKQEPRPRAKHNRELAGSRGALLCLTSDTPLHPPLDSDVFFPKKKQTKKKHSEESCLLVKNGEKKPFVLQQLMLTMTHCLFTPAVM